MLFGDISWTELLSAWAGIKSTSDLTTMACVFNKRVRFWLRAGSLWSPPTKSFAVWLTLKSVYLHFFHPHLNNSAMISLLITCKFGYLFVCHSQSWPVSLFSEAPNVYFFSRQTNFARKQQIPVPFPLIRTTRWQNLAVMAGGGWVRFTVSFTR